MPSDRLILRLSQLPHDVLAELAAQLCSESAALQAMTDECLATHKPLPLWAVDRVLLSPDLMPHILGPLELEDAAAAAVCSQWSVGWKATNEPRRRLKQVPFDLPGELAMTRQLHMTGSPDGYLLAYTDTGAHLLDDGAHLLDDDMRVLHSFEVDNHDDSLIAANDSSLFSAEDLQALRRFTFEGTIAAEYRLEDYSFAYPVLAPGDLLFCVIFHSDSESSIADEIVALDAQTLQLRFRFGLGLLDDTNQLVVVGDELYVCDTGNDRLQVFSLSGEHRRSVMGEWRSPRRLCFARDRLYLVEDGCADTAALSPGRRILVLSLLGDILQVITHPTKPTAQFDHLCCFKHNGRPKLLATYKCYKVLEDTDTDDSYVGVLALQGLM